MKLLAIDIGGTNSRFADCHYQSRYDFDIKKSITFNTRQKGINSFQDLLNHFNKNKPDSFLNVEEYNVVSIAIAGPVNGRQAIPPNISWNIDLDDIPALTKTYLINDFVAQAYAFSIPGEVEKLELISGTDTTKPDSIAIVGAGTGLGHSMLVSDSTNNSYHVIASEAGQACFTFTNKEKELESFFLNKTNLDYLINDQVVSGSGISLIHEYVTGNSLSPQDVFTDNNKMTLNYFSRFYARACRNFCLSFNLPNTLIITGGIAAKHPELIHNREFISEFYKITNHQQSLQNTSIYLNKKEKIGLIGAAFYALSF